MLSGDTLLMMVFMSVATEMQNMHKPEIYLRGHNIRCIQYSPENKGKNYLILVVIECNYLFCTLQKLKVIYKKNSMKSIFHEFNDAIYAPF